MTETKTKKAARDWRLAKYGLTSDEWEELFNSQLGACAACGSTDPGSKHGWQTDHCHKTGEVRGILCSGCNRALGCVRDSPKRLWALYRYLTGRAPDWESLASEPESTSVSDREWRTTWS